MSQTPEKPNDRNLAELPPVEPPTAGFVVQLFVLPFVVVAVVVLVYLLFGRLAGGERDAMDYVQTIRTGNENRRWRAAFELASLIQNDTRLARDPKLLGALTEELDRELRQTDQDPQIRQYLCRTLGAFQTREAVRVDGSPAPDPLATLGRAAQADQPTPIRLAAVESLARHAAQLEGRLEDPRVIADLDAVCEDSNAEPELRQLAVYALGFCGGNKTTEALRRRVGRGEEDRYVRYNAAAALARRGDEAALPTLNEMLTPSDLRQVVPVESPAATEHTVETIVLEALQALVIAIQQGHPELAQALRPQVKALTRSSLVGVRTQANAVLQLLQSR